MIFASLESLDLAEIRIELQAEANFELGLHWKVIVFTQVKTLLVVQNVVKTSY